MWKRVLMASSAAFAFQFRCASTGTRRSKLMMSSSLSMDNVVALCKKRGFIYGSSEIYNGLAGFFDYGPLGVEVKRNIKERWWREFVQERDDVVGLDSSIISSPKIWEASGHVAGFSDPMVDDKGTKKRYRADQLFSAKIVGEDRYVTVVESENIEADLKKKAKKNEIEEPFCVAEAPPEIFELLPPPEDMTRPGDLTEPRDFNLMFETKVGATDPTLTAFLRPETAQGIFVNFKNVISTTRVKLPLGIAQIGKAFRNEITPRNFIFRSREFEQMEIEYFVEENEWRESHEAWINKCRDWLLDIGLKDELIGEEVHENDKLAHYALACTDLTFKFPFGEQELQGVAARGNYDLTQHQQASGKSLEYYDEASKSKILPHVIEPSIGVDRLFLALVCSAYEEDSIDGEKRSVLKFHPKIAPVTCAVMPLVKKSPEIMALSKALQNQIRQSSYSCDLDMTGAIGRRYRRQDEIGTPFCVTVDFDSIQDKCATVRDRDTTEQVRIPIDQILQYITNKIEQPVSLDCDALLASLAESKTDEKSKVPT